MTVALKAAAARGTVTYLLTGEHNVRSGGYLLNLSHAPCKVNTYLFLGQTDPWIVVDGA